MATVKELREEAKRLGLKGYSKMNKAQLEEAVNNAQHQAQEQAHEDTPAVVEQNSTEQAQPQLQKISARDYLTLDEEQTISNANYSLLYNCDTKEEIIALLENTTKETMIYMIHHPDKRYTHFVAFHNNGNNLFEDHELDSWADSLKFTRKAVIVEDLASAIMRVKRSEAFHAKMQAAYELEQEALKWRPETPYEYERRMRYIHHLENMRTENPERYEKIRVKCVKDGIIRPDDLPSIHSINETPAVSEQPAVVQDEEEAITLLTIPENPCDRKHNQEYFDTSDNVRMLSTTLKTAKAIRESLGTIGTRCTLDDILDWLHKEPDWNYNRGYTYATSDEVIDAITEILTGHPRVITINVPHITDIVPPRFPNYELLGNRIPMKYYDEIVEILSPYTTREELFSALMMSPEPICDALNMKFLGKCPLTTPKGEVFFSGPQGTLSEALKPQWCAVMADCIIEHRQQAQPAIVELEINPYSGYFCGYDAERRAFLNRVKNGHVPQSVLAEISPEEYAQVMQEVSDMEKKEQEQELAHAAQPSQPAVVEQSAPIVEQPQPQHITPDNIAQAIINAKDHKQIFSALYHLSIPQLKALADSEHINLDGVVKAKQPTVKHIAGIISNRLNQLKAGNSIEVISMWGLPCSLESPITLAFWNSLIPAGQPRLQLLPDNNQEEWDNVLRANLKMLLACDNEQDMRNLLMTAGKHSQLDRLCDTFGCREVMPNDSRDSKINALIAQAVRYNASHPKQPATVQATTTSIFQPQPDSLIDYEKAYLASLVASETTTPAVVEYNPEFVEECYIPDYQDCPAVLDDIPEPREQTTPITAQSVPATPAVIEHQEQPAPVRKATHANPNFGTVRGMSTRELRAIAKRLDVDGYAKMDRLQLEEAASRKPRKFPRRAYDLGYCDNDKKLRRELSSLDPENVEIIARNLKGKTIELPTDSKLITKKFLIDAIVRAYFPQAQAKPTPKPKKQSNLDYVFEVGRQYFRGDRLEINYATAPIITILARKGNLLTIREEDTGFIYERRMKRHWRSIDYYEEVQIGNYDDCACSIPVDVIREKEFREITTAFQKTQRLLAYQAMFITRYMQPQPQPLALPAVVKHQEAPVQEVRHEAWKDHFCNHCNHAPTWTHAQFSTGILLSREYKKSSSKDSRRLWLTGRYNLAQLYTLAKALGLDIPKIELTSDYSKTDQKKLQIADIIWNEIISMEHVYTCTYEVNNPPALPAELVEPDPVHAAVPAIVPQPAPVAPAEISASATPNPHTDTVRKPAGKYSSFSDELISACTTRAQLAELFSHAANKQVLLDTLHRLGFSSVGLKGISTKQKLAGYLAGKIFLLGGISNLTTTAKIELPKPQITAPAVKVIEGKHGQLMLDFDDTEDTGTPPSQPVAVKSKTRTTRKSRIKRDNSRQLAFVFDEVTDCKSNQRQAA